MINKVNTKKHHFVQQKFVKIIFNKENYDVFHLDKYREDSTKTILDPYLCNHHTNEIFNSNKLLDNKSDEYWSKIENNNFLRYIKDLINPQSTHFIGKNDRRGKKRFNFLYVYVNFQKSNRLLGHM